MTIKAGAANLEDFGGADLIAVTHLKHSLDVDTLNFLQRKGLPGIDRAAARRRLLNLLGQIFNVDEITSRCNGRAGNGIFKFANIPRPMVLHQHSLGAARQSLEIFPVTRIAPLQEVSDEKRNILDPFNKAGNLNFDCA